MCYIDFLTDTVFELFNQSFTIHCIYSILIAITKILGYLQSFDPILECLDFKKRKGELVHFINRKEPEQFHFYTGLATLFTMGYPVEWNKITTTGQLAGLPCYPWQKSRYWNENLLSVEDRSGREGNVFLNASVASEK